MHRCDCPSSLTSSIKSATPEFLDFAFLPLWLFVSFLILIRFLGKHGLRLGPKGNRTQETVQLLVLQQNIFTVKQV